MPLPRPVIKVIAIWVTVAVFVTVPFVFAVFSPLLAYRDGPYIAAGLAGAAILGALLLQPLLGLGLLPRLSTSRARHCHRIIGPLIAVAVLVHVGGLYLTSPPDTIDALLLVSPTPFSVWGVLAMVGVFLAVVFTSLRKRMGLRRWRMVHFAITTLIVLGSVIHALLISGTMEYWSKLALCIALLTTTVIGMIYGRVIRPARRRNKG
ncbi:ferric reductase-like transmembrane domain-containing protein [Sulfitobacter sp.]|uniref:ferric reductase-like transmembrane domain-containing protein n=1 Tax=Sulfitobacter sp. TaxID=1903071 RepID=UPI0032969286